MSTDQWRLWELYIEEMGLKIWLWMLAVVERCQLVGGLRSMESLDKAAALGIVIEQRGDYTFVLFCRLSNELRYDGE